MRKRPNLALLLVLIFGLTFTPGISTLQAQTQVPSLPVFSIRTEEGSMSYMTAGPQDGEKVLLLHGLFAQKEQWIEMAKILGSRGYSVIIPDLPGYGTSGDYDISAYSLERQSVLLGKFMESLGLPGPGLGPGPGLEPGPATGTAARGIHIAGNSMGGAIALLYAEANPGTVLSLALIGAPLGAVHYAPPVIEAIRRGTNPFIPLSVKELDLELSLLFANPPALPDDIARAMVGDYTARERHFRQVWDIVNLYQDLFSSRRSLPPHTLVLWGEKDHIFPAEGIQVLSRLLPPGSAQILPGLGHLPHLEAPELIAGIYTGFLASIRF